VASVPQSSREVVAAFPAPQIPMPYFHFLSLAQFYQLMVDVPDYYSIAIADVV